MDDTQIHLLDKDEILPMPEKAHKSDKVSKKVGIFVVHEHDATRLHWDLRLEIDEVLKSWAIPKNPKDVDEGMRRLAIQVEDHPLEYANFEGTIPEGMYGAGTVKIYDIGEFILEEQKESKLSFELKGKKLIGKYVLIKTKYRDNSWLFFKKK